MLVIWHAIIFQLILAVKIFEESITQIDIDPLNNIIIISNSTSGIKMFKYS